MGSGNITISYAEYTRLLEMKTRIDVIDELDGIVDLKKDDILFLLGIRKEDE